MRIARIASVVAALASGLQGAGGQERSDGPPCKRLFAPRATGVESDAEIARITEKWLLAWYPTRKQFEDARARKIEEKTECLVRARAAVAELEQERDEFARRLEVYRGGAIPTSVRAYLDGAAASLGAAKEHELVQVEDLVRIHRMYDAQLQRLQGTPGWR